MAHNTNPTGNDPSQLNQSGWVIVARDVTTPKSSSTSIKASVFEDTPGSDALDGGPQNGLLAEEQQMSSASVQKQVADITKQNAEQHRADKQGPEQRIEEQEQTARNLGAENQRLQALPGRATHIREQSTAPGSQNVELQFQVEALTTIVADLITRSERQNGSITALRRENTEFNGRITVLEGENAGYRGDIDRLKAVLNERNAELESQRRDAAEERATHATNIQELNQSIANLNTANQDLQSRITDLTALSEQNQRLQTQITELRVVNEDLRARLEQQSTQPTDLSGRIEAAVMEANREKDNQIRELNADVTALREENQRRIAELTVVEQEKASLKRQIDELKVSREKQGAHDLRAQQIQHQLQNQKLQPTVTDAQRGSQTPKQGSVKNQRTVQAVRQEATTATRQFQQQYIVAAPGSSNNSRLKSEVRNFKEEAEAYARELPRRKAQLEATIADLERQETELTRSWDMTNLIAQKQAELSEVERLLQIEDGRCLKGELYGLGLLALLAAPVGMTNAVTDWAQEKKAALPRLTLRKDQLTAEYRRLAGQEQRINNAPALLISCGEQLREAKEQLEYVMCYLEGRTPDLELIDEPVR